MITKEIREIIIHELPEIVKHDEEIHQLILQIAHGKFAEKQETESRFDRVLNEIRRDREAQEKKWEENQKIIYQILDELKRVDRRIDQTIGALGARWGIQSEEAFRNGLKAILEVSFGVEVIHINEWDDTGVVFGHPDQVELDVIIQNGQLIICELKSSISKSEVYTFEKKVKYYESVHQRTCQRMLIISPMVDDNARKVAGNLGIEIYTHSGDVKP